MSNDNDLIDEYEKKYMMDQAFTDNETYFRNFRQDIRSQRGAAKLRKFFGHKGKRNFGQAGVHFL